MDDDTVFLTVHFDSEKEHMPKTATIKVTREAAYDLRDQLLGGGYPNFYVVEAANGETLCLDTSIVSLVRFTPANLVREEPVEAPQTIEAVTG